MENEQTVHDKNFIEWFDVMDEEKKENIFTYFYSDLRQQNGLLEPLDKFWWLCWMHMTLEGSELLHKMIEQEHVCSNCAEDIDSDESYHKSFVRWKIQNKSLMYDLNMYFYDLLLNPDGGGLIEFDEFMFSLWKFVTPEGLDLRVEIDREIEEEHKS